jgi:hypothetical protein
MREPTYTAKQVREMCSSMDLDYEGFKVLSDLIDEEIDLYSADDLPVLVQASMIVFTRSLLKFSLKRML